MIEILFQEGLIKCLFATETFSIGINMPAKTVVFTQTRKFDGQDFRWITPGEYIQMSGRAGRRGKDLRGTVIQMIDEKMDPVVAKNMIYGSSDPLSSSYRVGYNMVLNMLRVEDSDPENLLRCSFHQYQQEQLAPELERQAGELQVEADEIIITGADEKVVSDYYLYNRQLVNTRQEMYQEIMKPSHSLPFLASGRLVRVQAYGVDWGWGMVVNYRKAGGSSLTGFSLGFDGDRIDADTFIVDILLNVSKRSANTSDEGDSTTESQQEYEPVSYDSQKGQLEVIRVALRAIVEIAQVRMTIPKDLTKSSTKKNIQNSIREVLRRFATKGGIPELNPIEDIGITHEGFRELFSKYLDLNKNLTESKLNENSKKDEILKIYSSKMDLLERAEVLRAKAQESQAVAMREDLTKMKNVLRQLDFISKDGVLGMKGRFSCELSIADEIVLTEMIFDGSFNDLTPQQAAALMSCFVHKEGSQQTSSVIPVMDAAHKTLQQIVRKVAKVSIENQLISDEEEYVKSFNPDMIEVAYHWSSGSKFSEICKLTDIFEGSIIRVLRRLEELLRQMSSAAFAIGNFELKVKFEQAAISLRRGVVFAASLYI